jgi:DNA-binding transcriptional ArsR family regulator
VDVFAALADPVRRSLLRSLTRGPARVVDLAAGHPISRPAVSKHLRVLTEAGLVRARDHGRERHYELVRGALAPVGQLVTELSNAAAPPLLDLPTLDALDTEVRRTTRDRRAGTRALAHERHEHEETA